MRPESVIVIGGGPAGCIAAASAAKAGAKVLLLERNEKIGRKLRITGKGRCNVTNACARLDELIAAVPGNGRFLYGAFSRFMPSDTMDYFESLGVPLKIERGSRVFPASDRADDIVDALRRDLRASGVTVRQARVVRFECSDGRIAACVDEAGARYPADRFVLATGGVSYPGTGSTGDGYELARQCGHTVIPPRASLVPLETSDGYTGAMQGLSLRNTAMRLYEGWREIYRDFGELLFTHFGVSGPIVLSASAHMRKENADYRMELDLKPALSEKQLDARILRDFAEFSKKELGNGLVKLLPSKMIPVVCDLAGIPASTRVNAVTKEQRRALLDVIKAFPVTIRGRRPIEEAVVTAGGVATKEIDPKTMGSKLCENLYLAGEVIDVDAYTGGFNLQIAFATGRAAGLSAAEI